MTRSSTRGKARWVVKSGGGAVRNIEKATLLDAYKTAFGECPKSPELLDEVQNILKVREVTVTNPQKTITQKDLEKLAKKAADLQKCLREFPDMEFFTADVMHSNVHKIRPISDLYFWLVALQNPERYLRRISDANSFKFTICNLAELLETQGKTISTTSEGPFGTFLEVIETSYPGLVFPSTTVKTARRDYIRSSLSSRE